jgi:hypothetical protein
VTIAIRLTPAQPQPSRFRAIPAFVCAVAPLLVLASVWYPEWHHYRIDVPSIPAGEAARIVAASDVDRIAELSALDLGPVAGLTPPQVVEAAEGLVQGRIAMPGSPVASVAANFVSENLADASSLVQLDVASLVIPDVYLSAAKVTGDPRWTDRASDYLHRWWDFERSTVFPTGLQWNDHAVAARIYVLTRYWSAVAKRPDFAQSEAPWLLEALSRSAALLLKPEYFTFRTNHGVMQTLALLHVAACFPQLPLAERAAQLGFERLILQMPWMLSREGVVLEHSVGYHQLGVRLYGSALRYFTAMGRPVPSELAQRYEGAKAFYATLRRPDGTLPVLGDTNLKAAPPVVTRVSNGAAEPLESEPFTWGASAQDVLLPLSGYAVLWNTTAPPAQTAITWSNFATRSHKHADDLSALIWRNNQDWITATAYWPYDSALRDAAVGWCGSNGPHFAGESNASGSASALEQWGFTPRSKFLHLSRTVATGRIERQIVALGGDAWLIVDSSTAAAPAEIETCWTFDPAVGVEVIDSGGVWLASAPDGERLSGRFLAAQTVDVATLRESKTPFGGWVSREGRLLPATTLKTRVPAGSWSVTLLSFRGLQPEPVVQWQSPREWSMQWETEEGTASISRTPERLDVGQESLMLMTANQPSLQREKAAIDGAFTDLQATWPAFPYSYREYRVRVSRVLLGLAGVQLLGIIVAFRSPRLRRHTRTVTAALVVGTLGWAGLGAWLWWGYFAT